MTPDGMKLSKEAKENLRRSWSEATSGLRALSVALLEEGIKFNPITVNPRRPVHPDPPVSGRRHRKAYRVAPHMIGLLELATHSNIEQQSLEFIIYTMLPWVT
jgi:phage portal protein BeeE